MNSEHSISISITMAASSPCGDISLSLYQDIRQRHRYLCHLPLTCEFSICELALKPPVISKETLELFSGLYYLSSRFFHEEEVVFIPLMVEKRTYIRALLLLHQLSDDC